MSAELLRMRLYEEGRLRGEQWEAHVDPEKPKAMRAVLLGAVAEWIEDAEDPKDHIHRFRLDWLPRSGPWRTFRAGS